MKIRFLIPVLVLPVLLVIITGCNKSGTGPQDTSSPVDYPVYAIDGAGSTVVCYWPSTGEVEEKEHPVPNADYMAVSVDGRFFYLSNTDSIVVVDSDSLHPVAVLPYSGKRMTVSPDGNYLAIHGSDLYILQTTDFSLVYEDTIYTYFGHFSEDSRRFYTAHFPSQGSNPIHEIDLITGENTITSLPGDPGTFHLRVLPMGHRLLSYAAVGSFTDVLLDYDAIADSAEVVEYLSPGAGYMVLSPDCKRLYYNNPGTMQCFPDPTRDFRVYDLELRQVVDTISTQVTVNGEDIDMLPGSMVITPDGRYLVLRSCNYCRLRFLTYDLEIGEFVDYVANPDWDRFSELQAPWAL